MKNHPEAVMGFIELRGQMLAAAVPSVFLTFDASSFACERADIYRSEASCDMDFNDDERENLQRKATILDQWVAGGCEGRIDFLVNNHLFVRSAVPPMVVTDATFEEYIERILALSELVPIESAKEPQFTIRRVEGHIELLATDSDGIYCARRYPGPDIRVIHVTVEEIKAIIAR